MGKRNNPASNIDYKPFEEVFIKNLLRFIVL